MTEQEINYFLDEVTLNQQLIESIEGLRAELRNAMAPMLSTPKYKKNYWLKKSGLKLSQRIIMQLLVDEGPVLSYDQLITMTGMTRKGLRDSLEQLADMRLTKRGKRQNLWTLNN